MSESKIISEIYADLQMIEDLETEFKDLKNYWMSENISNEYKT